MATKVKREIPAKEWLEKAYLIEGQNIFQIAEQCGVGKSTVFRWLQHYGIPNAAETQRISREYLDEEYRIKGLSAQQIADNLGIKRDKIQHLIAAYDIPRQIPHRKVLPHVDRDTLYQLYVVENKSAYEIAKITDIEETGIRRLLLRCDIPVRPFEFPQAMGLTKEQLYQWHIVEGLTAKKIAAIVGCNHTTISNYLRRYNIKSDKLLVNKPTSCPVGKEELWKQYAVEKMSIRNIARFYAVSVQTARRWFDELHIPVKTKDVKHKPESLGRKIKHNTRDDHEFTVAQRGRILHRDQHSCRMPGCGSTERWMLEIHHIIPIKSGGSNHLTNGITLCKTCHDNIRGREINFIATFQELAHHHKTD